MKSNRLSRETLLVIFPTGRVDALMVALALVVILALGVAILVARTVVLVIARAHVA